jgi:hypothetical protein
MTTSGVLQVSMLDELRGPFEAWLEARGLLLVHMPGHAEDVFVVVPDPAQVPPPSSG